MFLNGIRSPGPGRTIVSKTVVSHGGLEEEGCQGEFHGTATPLGGPRMNSMEAVHKMILRSISWDGAKFMGSISSNGGLCHWIQGERRTPSLRLEPLANQLARNTLPPPSATFTVSILHTGISASAGPVPI